MYIFIICGGLFNKMNGRNWVKCVAHGTEIIESLTRSMLNISES